MKTCFKCGETKSLSQFYRHRMMKDGHLNKCKECAKRDVRDYRAVNESVREYDRRRYRENERRRASVHGRAAKWRANNPEKRKAHEALGNAVRDRRVMKPSRCENCGDDSRVIHGHHSDYSKPLDVQWLCARCHGLLHSRSHK